MATSNFHARIQRIEKAQLQTPQQASKNLQTYATAGVQAAKIAKSNRPTAVDHLMSVLMGLVLGCAVSIALLGLSIETSPWGPDSAWHGAVYFATMACLGLAPVLVLISLFTASKRPGLALYSLAYLSGIVIPLFL